jgi:glycerol-3-phosphate acyltransferase PlsY
MLLTAARLWFKLYLPLLSIADSVGSGSIVEVFYALLLAVSAFWLGACPFSVWVGQRFLGKDIRDYGDGNPGAVNVFRAGGRKLFCLALILDVAKGVPFVLLAHSFWGFPEIAVIVVGLSAILGHAFSPMLGFRGGKSIAVTIGVLSALPQHEILFAFIIFLFIGFLFMESDAWTVMLGAVGSLAYLVATRGTSGEALFMLCVLAILAVKHFDSLKTMPKSKVRLLAWIQSRRR